MSDSILRLPEVEKICGMKSSTIYRHMEAGTFPQSVPLGTRNVGWLQSEIDAWVEGRKVAREVRREDRSGVVRMVNRA